MNPPRNRKGEIGNPPPTTGALEFYPNETAPAGHPRNGGALASRRLPVVLVLAVADSTRRREETLEQGSARPDLPHGRREPDVGSTLVLRCENVGK